MLLHIALYCTLLLCLFTYMPLQQPVSGIDYDAMRPQCKSLAVSLSTVGQLVGSFRQTYKEELHPWTSKEAPVFSGVYLYNFNMYICQICVSKLYVFITL